MKAHARVNEGALLNKLAGQVCLKAVADVRKHNPIVAVEAFLWMTSPDWAIWADAAGIPYADPIRLLTSGRAARAKTKVKTNR